MTSREARKLRRAAERKSNKLLRKQNRSSVTAARLDEPAAFSAAKTQGEPAAFSAAKTQGETQRRAKKAACKAAHATQIPAVDFDDEFSPEFIAEANAARERVEARMAAYRSSQSPQAQSIAPGSDEPAHPSAAKTQADEPAHPSAAKTPDRAQINRANAQHSTRPRSSEGKLASSRNSLKHGLASGQLIIPGENPAEFESLLQSLLDEHQPANTTEGAHRPFGGHCARLTIEMLIHEMAQSFWLTQRAIRLQNDCFSEPALDEKRLALLLRYQTTHQRAFHKALNTLIRLQKDRRRLAIGFVSQKRATEPISFDEAAPPSHPLGRPKTQANAFVSQNPVETPKSSPNQPPVSQHHAQPNLPGRLKISSPNATSSS